MQRILNIAAFPFYIYFIHKVFSMASMNLLRRFSI